MTKHDLIRELNEFNGADYWSGVLDRPEFSSLIDAQRTQQGTLALKNDTIVLIDGSVIGYDQRHEMWREWINA